MRHSEVRGGSRGRAWRYIGLLAVLVVLVVPPGCTTVDVTLAKKAYQGPDLAKHEVAFIVPRGSVKIGKIDGRGCAQPLWGVPDDIQTEDCHPAAEMRPGKHDIALSVASLHLGLGLTVPASATEETLSMNAQAGRGYFAHSSWSGGRAWFWIEDHATGQVVAGSKPSANN